MVIFPEPLDSVVGELSTGLTNFFGAAGTGKTNLCMLAAIDCIKNGGKVFYIDTEHGFSPERFKQLTPQADKYLEKITLAEPKDFQEQAKMLKNFEGKFDLIILDSSVALYRLESSEPKNNMSIHDKFLEANRELSKQLSVLSNISRTKRVPVIITSHTYKNWVNDNHEIVGGDSIKYWSKTIIFLEKTSKTSERKATIVKHRFMEEGKNVKFVLVEDGIKPSTGFKIF